MKDENNKLEFRGGMFMSLVPVAIFFAFCIILFVVFKAFNMEALAMGGFVALLIGGIFCKSYTKFWDSAIRGISSISSVSVIVIFFVIGMFSALMKESGLSGGFVWLANSVGIQGGLFVAFVFFATCIVSTATGSSIGTMFTAFPIFYPAGIILGGSPMFLAGAIVSGAIFGDNLAPISDTTIASASTQQFRDGRPADVGGCVKTRFKYSIVAGSIALVLFAILGGINLWLTLIIFAFIPVMLVVCIKLNFFVRATFRAQRRQIGEINARLEDTLLGERVVKAFAGEEVEKGKFEKDNVKFLDIKKQTYKWMALFSTTSRLFDGIMYLVVLVAGSLFMMKGLITAGDMVAYLLFVTTLLTTIQRIIEFSEQFQRGMTGIERFCEIMDADVEILDEPGAVPLREVKGDILFDDVSFEYPDDHNKVLHHLCLHIRAGEKLALVGPSGGGKTTLTNLIPRFYDPTSGRILIDGQDIKGVTLQSLRKAIGVVQQDVYLFSGTVYENIAYGRPSASREEVLEAARLAGADEFIAALRDGYDSYVGERGVKLSGGQKQRISIARVFLKNPPILILDEATSALDNESEHLVGQSLTRLAKGRTTLTIAHRLTTIQNADRILVLGSEGIEEEGTHDALLARRGAYYRLWTGAKELERQTF